MGKGQEKARGATGHVSHSATKGGGGAPNCIIASSERMSCLFVLGVGTHLLPQGISSKLGSHLVWEGCQLSSW